MHAKWSPPSATSAALIALLAISLALVPVPFHADDETEDARRHRVEMRRLEFQPSSLTVSPGDIVVWVNLDFVPHTVTARDDSWDSLALESNEEWEMRVSTETSGEYFCAYHPSMEGRLEVQLE